MAQNTSSTSHMKCAAAYICHHVTLATSHSARIKPLCSLLRERIASSYCGNPTTLKEPGSDQSRFHEGGLKDHWTVNGGELILGMSLDQTKNSNLTPNILHELLIKGIALNENAFQDLAAFAPYETRFRDTVPALLRSHPSHRQDEDDGVLSSSQQLVPISGTYWQCWDALYGLEERYKVCMIIVW